MRKAFWLLRLLSKAWFYFRIGNGTYLAFVISFIQFITVEYIFVIQRIPFLAPLHLAEFALLFLGSYGGTGILIGYGHMRSQVFTDAELSSPQSPYTYKMLPYGKEAKLNTPLGLEMLRLNREMARKLGVLTPELEKRLDRFEKMYETLLAGGEVR